MVSKKFVVRHAGGVDANHAAQLVRLANQYDCDVHVEFGQKRADGKSIMNVMAACMKQGSELELQCSGPDEAEMLQAAAGLINSGLGEE